MKKYVVACSVTLVFLLPSILQQPHYYQSIGPSYHPQEDTLTMHYFSAADFNNLATLQHILSQAPWLINAQDSNGNTALHILVRNIPTFLSPYHSVTESLQRAQNITTTIQYLKSRGANPNISNYAGQTVFAVMPAHHFFTPATMDPSLYEQIIQNIHYELSK